ncbi:hypothetical protein ASE85_10755 [Sphingobium sp. Leaf26]|uniref:TetR/AcrR family transcriptional regulator n=1 Tax=Sphingobium sp. Leaf26 TaxID=1735693 RepID=UPI0006F5D7FA|nr:TetR/AcrR family transcriptional regulator [Sphingobium sp. Leaf26]KQM99191.1 hypothetical protein ASE85_10755 [Sphingobium sp. Leaf26]
MVRSKTENRTRLRLLEAAEPLFASLGYDGVSLRTVAANAGAQLGAIPYHYGTKLALYRAIWEHWMPAISADVLLRDLAVHPAMSLEEQIRRLVTAFLNGPRILLKSERGSYFAAILVREANDPGRSDRTLLEEFIFPNGNLIRNELVRAMPGLSADRFDAGFKMTIGAIQIAFENDKPRSDDHVEALFAALTEFIVSGWLGLLRKKAA